MEFKHINIEPEENILEIPAVNDPQKKKRGRPKKNLEQPQPQPQTKTESSAGSNENIFSKIKNEISANEIVDPLQSPVQSVPTQIEQPSILDGYMIISFMDAIFPGIIKFIFKKKLEGVDTSKIMLNETQKNSLEPLADEIAKQVSQHISPLYAFILASGSMYYQNSLKYAKK